MAYVKAGVWQQMYLKTSFKDHKLVSHSKIRKNITILAWLPDPFKCTLIPSYLEVTGLLGAAKRDVVSFALF